MVGWKYWLPNLFSVHLVPRRSAAQSSELLIEEFEEVPEATEAVRQR